jgi:TRAP-type C4-dicarboxylate transport system permease small subunit
MELLIIYAFIAFFFGFNFTMDYFNEQRKNQTSSLPVILAVGFLVVFPITGCLWPLILMRQIFNSLRN